MTSEIRVVIPICNLCEYKFLDSILYLLIGNRGSCHRYLVHYILEQTRDIYCFKDLHVEWIFKTLYDPHLGFAYFRNDDTIFNLYLINNFYFNFQLHQAHEPWWKTSFFITRTLLFGTWDGKVLISCFSFQFDCSGHFVPRGNWWCKQLHNLSQ